MHATLWFLAALLACIAAAEEKKIVCYFRSRAIYRPSNGHFDVENIDPSLCTHLVYAFLGLNADATIRILDPQADLPDNSGKDGYQKFNKLREKNPLAKTLIAIGGLNEGSANFSQVVSDTELRKKFTLNAVAFVKKYGFNGLGFDWEYPSEGRGSLPSDKVRLVLLMKELRIAFDQAGLTLTAALGASRPIAEHSYMLPQLVEYLHFANIMGYDMHVGTESVTGLGSPLYPRSSEQGTDLLLNVDTSVRYWLSQGVPAKKLVLGVSFYGTSFTLKNPKKSKLGDLAPFPGKAGPYTGEPGYLGYNEICEMQGKQKWEVHFEEEQRLNYGSFGNLWVSYEDSRSLKEKAEYINKLGLGGAMIWSIETDDFNGICGEKYPLLKTLNKVLRP